MHLTRFAVSMAVIVAFGGAAFAAAEHDHQAARPAPPALSAPASQPTEPELPALGTADDLLKAMESMPAHDPEACCRLTKSPSKGSGGGHNH